MDKLISIYNFIKSDKKKERFDIILEPLQALTQLSALAFCPIGSKLTISNNLLYIQIPGWGQGLLRSFNNDKRDDLFYLFNVIIRFNTFYDYLKSTHSEGNEDAKLFKLLIKLAKQGIDNLLLTYSTIDQPSLLHTLQMYRTLLDNPDLITRYETPTYVGGATLGAGGGGANLSAGPANTKNSNSKKYNNENNTNDASSSSTHTVASHTVASHTVASHTLAPSPVLLFTSNEDINSKKGINDVFINIRKLYSAHERSILYHLLTLMEKHPDQHQTYIDAINAALNPVNNQIKKWINDNIVY